MNAILIILFRSAVCTTVLLLVYWLFLRKETFFRLNRFYLLAMIPASFLLPLLPAGWMPAGPATATLSVMLDPVVITPGRIDRLMSTRPHWQEILTLVYLAGLLLFLCRFSFQLFHLFSIVRKNGVSRKHGVHLVAVDRSYSPFSFFGLAFINEAEIPSGSMQTILAHEKVHMRQLHSADLVLLELAAAVQWFNPAAWLKLKEMKSIHEFLADDGVLQNGVSRPSYQQLILDETMGVRVNRLATNFNVSLLKKRIVMMTKPKSNIWAGSKVLLALPAFVLLAVLFTGGTTAAKAISKAVASVPAVHQIQKAEPAPVPQDKPKQEKQVKYVAPVTNEEKVYTEVEKMPSYPGGQEAMIKLLIENIKYPEEAIKKNVTGTVFTNFIVRTDGTITSAKIMRGIGSGCDEEALRVVKLMPKWNPGEQKGKKVDVQFVLPIKFALDGDKKDKPKK